MLIQFEAYRQLTCIKFAMKLTVKLFIKNIIKIASLLPKHMKS